MLAADKANVPRTSWLLDSGANTHIVNDIKYFTEMKPLNLNIGTVDGGKSMAVLGEGTAHIVI